MSEREKFVDGEEVPMPTEPFARITNCVVVPLPLFASVSNSGIVAEVEVAEIVRRAVGEEVPMETLPFALKTTLLVPPSSGLKTKSLALVSR